ncbi:MAG TPA: 1-deoxy-D-xylulose-5-phosphate reductoisomerase [Candidatus Saccharimonadales bacterium]|nr:1-deoxy-D-xylulose-5-phosphate reductoisomerase [Candidatus Saccharimonadales bacterium]
MKEGNVALLGSTGSIGESTLDLLDRLGGRFRVVSLAAGSNVGSLARQIRRYRPAVAAIGDPGRLPELKDLVGDPSGWEAPSCAAWGETPTVLTAGADGLLAAASLDEADLVLAGIVGAAGLAPTFEAVRKGRVVALANKEALVVAGDLMTATAARTGATLLPVDSEHNALHQCLRAGSPSEVPRLILTASGGPFFGREAASLAAVGVEEALNHPTWRMGRKITIDSATLMNKGLEVIEAHHLFGLADERIDVIVHPQSIVHSMVEYADGSVIAQLSRTDMRHPIQYALTWPERWSSPLPGLDLLSMGALEFAPPDRGTFRCLDLGYRALRAGGTMPAVLNAANEVAVASFLDRRLGFLDIPRVIESVMERHEPEPATSLEGVLDADSRARRDAEAAVKEIASAGRRAIT